MTYKDYYADKQNCFNDIIEARKGWGYSLESDQQIHKTLGIMFLYCPGSIQTIVEATLHELGRRMELCLLRYTHDN